MFEPLVIRSHKGPYQVLFEEDALERLNANPPADAHFIIDDRIATLYASPMDRILVALSVLRIEATEEAKSLDRFPVYVEHLIGKSVRRDHVLIAIGGGIVQDITCFLAATLLRGIDWRFLPTTLLAQADSCIGSKSSINCGRTKNILGTFTPPKDIRISTRFLGSLDEKDVRSGIGEILKVHAIEGPSAFDQIAADCPRLLGDQELLRRYVRRALEIKRRYVEQDEFDRDSRNVFNYGHTFGHAIEAATDFAVPHGIAVTIGMDMANYTAARIGLAPEAHFRRMHPILKANFRGFETTPVPMDRFVAAIARDKKNIGSGRVTLILPGLDGRVASSVHSVNEAFHAICAEYLANVRGRE